MRARYTGLLTVARSSASSKRSNRCSGPITSNRFSGSSSPRTIGTYGTTGIRRRQRCFDFVARGLRHLRAYARLWVLCLLWGFVAQTGIISAATVDEQLAACSACHGASGQSSIPETPSLGAQPEFYVSVQLYLFREGMRVAEPMNAMLKPLSDADLQRMAQAIAKLPPPAPATGPNEAGRFERARQLVQQHRCDFCHNPDFAGAQGAPRLASQREDYLVKALREYKNNSRRAYDPSMADVMVPLTDGDILDLAYFLARQP
jgi:cytochrome c553